MSTDITFTPLYGVLAAGPVSFLLQLGGLNILLDCGWAEPFDPQMLLPLRAVVDSLDAVLISHPDLAHMGALPFLMGRLGLSAPVYATGAAHKMGQMCLYDAYLAHRAAADFDAFDLDDVDAAFSRLTQLRYRQEVQLSARRRGVGGPPVTIIPQAAGRLLGGAIWRLAAGGEEVVYAIDFNHRRERHLAGAALDAAFLRPVLLVADASAVGRLPSDRERCERALIDSCLAALRADGNVLVPMDAAGRVLEVALVLERHWGEHKLSYPVALLGPMGHTTLEFARSQLEWMNESLVRSFGHSKDNPYNLRHVRPCASIADLRRMPPGPKVVLAPDPSLCSGASRALFADWADDPRSAVLFLLEPDPGSLGAAVLASAAERDARPGAPPPLLQVALSKRVPLRPEELREHQAAEEARRTAAAGAADGGTTMGAGGGAFAPALAGGSPRAAAAAAATQQPMRANSAAIGHLSRNATGRGEVVAADGLPLMDGAGGDEDEEEEEMEAAGECLVEGFQPREGAAAPMFPAEDEWEAVQVDAYGEVEELAAAAGEAVGGRLGKALATEAAAECADGGAGEAAARDGDGAALSLADVPTKVESRERVVALAARVLRIDFDGRSDGRSVQTMLAQVAPRAAAVVHAPPPATAALASLLRRELQGLHAAVHTPAAGEAVRIPGSPSFEVDLSEQVARSVEMHAVGGYDLAWVDGVVGPPAVEEPPPAAAGAPGAGQQPQAAQYVATVPTLLPRPPPDDALVADDGFGGDEGGTAAAAAAAEAQHAGVFIGDVRLSELKRALGEAGIAADFHGGALHCVGRVIVRRHGEGGGGLVLEGGTTEEYYKVREVVYAQYHVC